VDDVGSGLATCLRIGSKKMSGEFQSIVFVDRVFIY